MRFPAVLLGQKVRITGTKGASRIVDNLQPIYYGLLGGKVRYWEMIGGASPNTGT